MRRGLKIVGAVACASLLVVTGLVGYQLWDLSRPAVSPRKLARLPRRYSQMNRAKSAQSGPTRGHRAGNSRPFLSMPTGSSTTIMRTEPNPPPKRGRCGPTSRPRRAEIGSSGSSPPGSRRLARVGSTTPARCSRPGSAAFAASIAQGSIVRA
jgi:hypothetical protein